MDKNEKEKISIGGEMMTKEQHEKLYQQLNAEYHKNIEPVLLAKQWRDKRKWVK